MARFFAMFASLKQFFRTMANFCSRAKELLDNMEQFSHRMIWLLQCNYYDNILHVLKFLSKAFLGNIAAPSLRRLIFLWCGYTICICVSGLTCRVLSSEEENSEFGLVTRVCDRELQRLRHVSAKPPSQGVDHFVDLSPSRSCRFSEDIDFHGAKGRNGSSPGESGRTFGGKADQSTGPWTCILIRFLRSYVTEPSSAVARGSLFFLQGSNVNRLKGHIDRPTFTQPSYCLAAANRRNVFCKEEYDALNAWGRFS
ncbi:hypothetical protein WN51_08377 [Melipona quadrifasciata]|uniref:Uncharacterized protein n=1 Tax=Melipona quadrifasciata TaxID=166423 RepID=A0A0M9A9X3_9HYME|nr:hypothetical protein WN51_08377 [Melipona quadrifasciata]